MLRALERGSKFKAERSMSGSVYLVYFVSMVDLVSLVCLVFLKFNPLDWKLASGWNVTEKGKD